MNPHDPNQRPGSHLGIDVLGVEADELAAAHPPGDPRGLGPDGRRCRRGIRRTAQRPGQPGPLGTGPSVRFPAGTVESLRTKQAIARDASVSPFREQRLSPADQGMSVLQAARDAGSRASAALRRSRPAQAPDLRPPGPAPAPTTRSADRPSCSR